MRRKGGKFGKLSHQHGDKRWLHMRLAPQITLPPGAWSCQSIRKVFPQSAESTVCLVVTSCQARSARVGLQAVEELGHLPLHLFRNGGEPLGAEENEFSLAGRQRFSIAVEEDA